MTATLPFDRAGLTDLAVHLQEFVGEFVKEVPDLL
jgi:hypothetical protein